jgi:hypothetical protein
VDWRESKKTARSIRRRITTGVWRRSTATPLDIRFETSPGDKAAAFIKEKAQYPMRQVATDDIGFAIYQLDLSK